MGLDNFRAHDATLPLNSVDKIFIGSDGAIPVGFDIHTNEGLRDYVALLNQVGVEGLRAEIERSAAADPDFELGPRFRDIDDMALVQVSLNR